MPITDETLIEDLEISVRTANALRLSQIKTVAELRAALDRDLLRLPSFGRKSLEEVYFIRWSVDRRTLQDLMSERLSLTDKLHQLDTEIQMMRKLQSRT